MGALTDLILTQTDPVTAILLIVIVVYARRIEKAVRKEVRQVRKRVERLEDDYFTDGGEPRHGNDD